MRRELLAELLEQQIREFIANPSANQYAYAEQLMLAYQEEVFKTLPPPQQALELTN